MTSPADRDDVALIILGATGDLTSRLLLPGLAGALAAHDLPRVTLVGSSHSEHSTDEWRSIVREGLAGAALDEDEAREILREAPGVQVIDKREDGGYVTPVDAAGEFAVYVSRIRKDHTVENGLSFWVVSDNLRKGAALNAVQIAQLLDETGVVKVRQLHGITWEELEQAHPGVRFERV